ncbi:hypothetical protein KBB89_03065 [Candidatus Gracilibacteria bacterium]|nr:hypothetical protein [Candidatus Gracilibacteria bacterium]
MPETTTQPAQAPASNLFPVTGGDASGLTASPLSGGLPGVDMSQSEKDAIMRQIHPIFLTTHSEEKAPVQQGNFDKFLGFLRLCLEGFLKLVDIVVDAAIQIARLFVWVIAIIGVLIVVTLMTNTTDKFIDILNSSIFPIVGLETKIQKVGPTNPVLTIPADQQNLESSTISGDNTEDATSAEIARQELIKARRARLAGE